MLDTVFKLCAIPFIDGDVRASVYTHSQPASQPDRQTDRQTDTHTVTGNDDNIPPPQKLYCTVLIRSKALLVAEKTDPFYKICFLKKHI